MVTANHGLVAALHREDAGAEQVKPGRLHAQRTNRYIHASRQLQQQQQEQDCAEQRVWNIHCWPIHLCYRSSRWRRSSDDKDKAPCGQTYSRMNGSDGFYRRSRSSPRVQFAEFTASAVTPDIHLTFNVFVCLLCLRRNKSLIANYTDVNETG